ncbi:MAG: hypothetical protein GY928_38965 [Colwellia sp.]|nr:hypothetical protein [Colwellia sp.]
MEHNKREAYKLDNAFVPLFTEVLQAGGVEWGLGDGDKKVINWSVNHAVVYCFLMSQFSFMFKAQFSMMYISSCCNMSESTIKRIIKDLEDIDILSITKGFNAQGVAVSNTYDHVKDIIKSVNYKLVDSNHRKRYMKKLRDRKSRLALLKGEVISNNLTPEQVRFLWKNRAYEERTGVYLQGDKTKGILYQFDKAFTKYDELKDYEIKELEEDKRSKKR